MSKIKYKVLAVIFMLVLAVALAACSSDDDTLAGTYVVEGEEGSGVTITFTGDNFRFVIPYSEIEMDFDLPGNFVLSGTFSIDNRNNAVNLYPDVNALRTSVSEMIDMLLEYLFDDPELEELMQDPEFAAFMEEYMGEMMDEMFDEMFEHMLEEFTDMGLRFDRNFDRLYDDIDDIVFVRQ